MKIGLIGQFRYPCSIEKYYLRALKTLGHQVVLDADSIISGAQKVDLTIVVKWFDHPEMLPHPRAMIFPDLTTRFQDYYNKVEKYFDYVFLAHNEKKLVNNKRIFYLPFAFDETVHTPLKRKRIIDLLFVGTNHPGRNDLLLDLPNITIFGNGWGNDIRDVYGKQLQEIYARTKIALNYRYPGDSTNMRQYEVLAQNVFLLSDYAGEFKEDYDLVVYKNKEDLLNKINYYLKHDDEREQIARRGYRTITEGKFKYVDRIKELLKICEVG